MVTIANHNLGLDLLNKINNNEWKFFKINENPNLLDESNTDYFFSEKNEDTNNEHKCFKNKVMIKTVDGMQYNAHIIHWVRSGGWGCISFDEFWNQFNDKGEFII
jgi:hypothetical protein